ncbi:MAG: 6-pyruvoyl trahydropterin synthase family protein [Acidimicrobiales bacterium]
MAPRGAFKVTVAKEDLVFAAAHFITLPGHRCESLHGHNYRAGLVVEGGLGAETWFVVDFIALKRLMKRLTDELDHRVLLPTGNPKLTVATEGSRVVVAYGGERRYVFPAADCVLLPVANTTAEMLAAYLAGRVLDELRAAGARHLTAIELAVEESFGQSAVYRDALTP